MSKIEKLHKLENSSLFADVAPSELSNIEGGNMVLVVVAVATICFAAGYVAGYRNGAGATP